MSNAETWSRLLTIKGAFGGLLMGLANLVPGISGGTMLLSVGVYPEFIGAVAEITTFRFRARSLILFAAVVSMAAVAVLLFAGPTKDLVVTHRWIMYSLFIGLTLGGIPIVWRLARPLSAGVLLGGAAGLMAMILMALSDPVSSSSQGPAYLLLFTAGVAGASAMILPGVSGGYLLLLLGQYVPILSAVDDFKTGLLGPSLDPGLMLESLQVGVPVGLGVATGVVAVSNLLRLLLKRFRKATLGLLLGLLLGAVIGLWPFQEPVPPAPGQTIKGRLVTSDNRGSFDQEDWPTARFSPSGAQLAAAAGLVAVGFAVTVGIARLGGREHEL